MTMTALQRIQNLASQVADTQHDMNVATKGGGGGGARILPKGMAKARFIGYMEMGDHIQSIKGKPKDRPDRMVRIGFALWGKGKMPDGSIGSFENEDGTPAIRWYPYELNLSANEKAKTFRLFKAMNWKGTAKQFIGLLGQAFLLPVDHDPSKDDPTKIFNVFDIESIKPPFRDDPDTGETVSIDIPEAPDDVYTYFLWDNPDQADLLRTFHDLYVEGKWDDGKSKNRFQERMLSAVNFPGSPLETALSMSGANIEMPSLEAPAAPVQAVPNVPDVPAAPTATAPVVPSVPTIPAVPAAPAV